jgi:8-oxo-dGTP pyrophosphatase MutT (NUDIX family)
MQGSFAPILMATSEVKKASTVILLREAAGGGLETLLTRRPSAMGFLGGAYVFPGGTVKKEDSAEALVRLDPAGPAAKTQKVALDHRVAGIRELYEEVGILLCIFHDGRFLFGDRETTERLDRKRRRLLDNSLSFSEFLESERLVCDVGRLRPFSRWLTPEEFSVRFDTRFYLAVLAKEPVLLATSPEVSHSLWISPEDSLRRYERGELPMIFPTFASLRTLTNFESLESVLDEYPATEENGRILWQG